MIWCWQKWVWWMCLQWSGVCWHAWVRNYCVISYLLWHIVNCMLIFAYYLKRHSVRMRLGPMPIKMFHFTTHLSAFNSIPQSNQMPNWHYLRLPWCGYYRIWVYPMVCILLLIQLKFTAIYLWFCLSLLKSTWVYLFSTWLNLSLSLSQPEFS